MGKFGFAALGKRIKLSVFSFDVQDRKSVV